MNLFTHNVGLKVISLLLAALTWFFVKGITSDRRTIEDVPLEIKVRPGFLVLQSDAGMVNVVVSGTREDVRQISRQDVSAVLDLTHEERTGEWPVRVRKNWIRAPRRVQVEQVQPERVTVRVDELVERDLRVEPQFAGTPPAGLTVERVMIEPQTVRVKGPKSLLETQTTIATLPIDVAGRRSSFRESVELAPLPAINGAAHRRWVQADVRIVEALPVDTPGRAGVQENR